MKPNVYIVNIPRKSRDTQVYMQSFCQAWMACGGASVEQSPWLRYRICGHLMKLAAMMHWGGKKHDKAFLICSRGGHLLKASIPYLFHGEIIPMLWDCWPSKWNQLEKDLRLIKCKMCFCTSSDTIKEFSKRLPNIQFVHVPEGVDTTEYIEGKALTERNIDVYEMGRKHNFYHKKLMDGNMEERCVFVHKPTGYDVKLELVYMSWNSFTEKLADSKIVISFPASMTNPKYKGTVETLTMRYWESMLSRCVMVGHCPQELIDLIGYNPVIEADFVNPCGQIDDILSHLEDYQEIVDHNRETALKFAPWDTRMSILLKALENYS